MKRIFKTVFLVLIVLIIILVIIRIKPKKYPITRGDSLIEKKEGNTYNFFLNDKPFEIKGVVGHVNYKLIKNIGANTIRVYDTKNLKSILDSADNYDLKVIVGLFIPSFKQGYEELSPNVKVETIKQVTSEVNKYKEHPALLFWMVGNEVVSRDRINLSFLFFINELAKTIHEIDPNHMVSSCFSHSRVFSPLIHFVCSELDFISYNNFGGLFEFKERILHFIYGYDGAVLITEWGNYGHWETSKNIQKCSIEDRVTKRLTVFNELFQTIQSIPSQIGSCAFRWDYHYETTFTLWSLLSPTKSRTNYTDLLQKLYSGSYPQNQSPFIDSISFNGIFNPYDFKANRNNTTAIKVFASDLENDSLFFVSEIYAEGQKNKDYFQLETPPPNYSGHLSNHNSDDFFISPLPNGLYRLYIHTYDNQGGSSSHNIPFYVD